MSEALRAFLVRAHKEESWRESPLLREYVNHLEQNVHGNKDSKGCYNEVSEMRSLLLRMEKRLSLLQSGKKTWLTCVQVLVFYGR